MKWVAAAALVAAALPTAAHDSWLLAAPSGELVMRTGNRYPVGETDMPVPAPACVRGRGRQQFACWAELKEHEVTLSPELVAVYFREIRPADAVRAAWGEQLERGLPWVERYRKFARIEHGTASATPDALRRMRAPAGLPLEIVIEGDAPVRAGATVGLRVLADGRPVAGLSVELVSERSALGIWSRSDPQGRLQHLLPFPGQWLVRATWVEPDGQRWRSRFVTLAFEAAPP